MSDGDGDLAPPDAGGSDSGGGQPMERLISTLISDYDLLLQRLGAHLGSNELAAEALHEIYVKLRAGPNIERVRHPRPYLYRMAINLILNQRRKDGRSVAIDDAFIQSIPDEAPSPEDVVLATDELNRAVEHLRRLPGQRRQIFLARWRDEMTQAEIASSLGLHKRTVQKELDRAERYLRRKLLR